MSLSRETRARIKQYILEKIANGEQDFARRTIENFGVSKNTVYRYLRELKSANQIVKQGREYRLVGARKIIPVNLGEAVSEDSILIRDILPLIRDLPQNVVDIWQYCFTEMMNNAIDHSAARMAVILFERDAVNTTIVIQDNGIGIFKKISDYYGFESVDDAILELFKGKLTTDRENHSGEGIFFASRTLDLFAAISDGKIFSHTEYDEVVADIQAISPEDTDTAFLKGTTIIMRLSNTSNKILSEIMDRYADIEGGFKRTDIPIKNVFPLYPVSRSQAKRLSHRFEAFQEVGLDFEGVEKIGQGFAHELFVVFKRNHPEVKLIPYRTNQDVGNMIAHVQADLKL